MIASVHTSFRIGEKEMTERVVAAIEQPARRLHRPPDRADDPARARPYDIDIERVAEAAAANGTMLEINGNPNRRDLSEHNARLAAEAGGDDRDQHRRAPASTMANMGYGVATARRAWLTADQVANTRDLAGLREAQEARKLPCGGA